MRLNHNFSLRQNPITSDDLADFVRCYRANDRSKRRETSHFRRFSYAELTSRDKASLDIQWQPETTISVHETPQMLMQEILKDLEEAMKEFAAAESEIRRP